MLYQRFSNVLGKTMYSVYKQQQKYQLITANKTKIRFFLKCFRRRRFHFLAVQWRNKEIMVNRNKHDKCTHITLPKQLANGWLVGKTMY